MLIYILGLWILLPFLTKYKRRILNVIDDKNKKANQSREPTSLNASDSIDTLSEAAEL